MATTWVWILVYVLGFCLFQVLLYRYLRKDDTSFEQAMPDYGDSDGDGPHRHAPSVAVTEKDHDGVQCQHCGAYNEKDAAFDYCRECAEPIRGGP